MVTSFLPEDPSSSPVYFLILHSTKAQVKHFGIGQWLWYNWLSGHFLLSRGPGLVSGHRQLLLNHYLLLTVNIKKRKRAQRRCVFKKILWNYSTTSNVAWLRQCRRVRATTSFIDVDVFSVDIPQKLSQSTPISQWFKNRPTHLPYLLFVGKHLVRNGQISVSSAFETHSLWWVSPPRIIHTPSVWPDWSKSSRFGKFLKIFGHFLRVYLVLGKMFNLLWQFFMLWVEILLLNLHNIEHTISTSGLTAHHCPLNKTVFVFLLDVPSFCLAITVFGEQTRQKIIFALLINGIRPLFAIANLCLKRHNIDNIDIIYISSPSSKHLRPNVRL